ncbi:MAG: HD domain-containing protein [Desulfobacterales bacterium]|nr:HD domain-containing protein [Desulfobacterales bacterium]MCP4160009.1 HD domain-containing protein [Deltaproteobacteria bacterium]
MKEIINLLFEAKMLKELQRSGLAFLGAGKESVAEHSYMVSFIGFVMSSLEKDIDSGKLLKMCLLHDLPESRTGDINYVQKHYIEKNEAKAVSDMTKDIPFGKDIEELIAEFNSGSSKEAKLAKDADQLAFLLELKSLHDVGSKTSKKWISVVKRRVKTKIGKKIAEKILETEWDNWWMKNYVD